MMEESVMRGNVRRFRAKARKLLRVYSQWHLTHQEELERRYLTLLAEILAVNPRFNMHQQFRKAF